MTSEEEEMFGLKKRTAPTQPFTHSYDCRIVKADPGVTIPWSYSGDGLWTATCVCTTEYFREPLSDDRVRLDPLDPKTAHHLGQCEFVGVTDAAVLRLALKVRDGAGGDYWWVECAGCDTAWQVPHYESVRT